MILGIPVTVVNVATHGRQPDVTYIGRGTIYGNPVVMQGEQDRDRVCDEYVDYFIDRVQTDQEFIDALGALEAKALEQGYLKLGCHCAPRRCHGDTVAGYLRNLLSKTK
jgi:hypothetical protein